MRFVAFPEIPRLIEPLAPFSILLKAKLIIHDQVVASWHLEHRATYVSLTIPESIDDPIDIVDLEELIVSNPRYVLEHCPTFDVSLLKLDLEFLRIGIGFIYLIEHFFELFLHSIDS